LGKGKRNAAGREGGTQRRVQMAVLNTGGGSSSGKWKKKLEDGLINGGGGVEKLCPSAVKTGKGRPSEKCYFEDPSWGGRPEIGGTLGRREGRWGEKRKMGGKAGSYAEFSGLRRVAGVRRENENLGERGSLVKRGTRKITVVVRTWEKGTKG